MAGECKACLPDGCFHFVALVVRDHVDLHHALRELARQVHALQRAGQRAAQGAQQNVPASAGIAG